MRRRKIANYEQAKKMKLSGSDSHSMLGTIDVENYKPPNEINNINNGISIFRLYPHCRAAVHLCSTYAQYYTFKFISVKLGNFRYIMAVWIPRAIVGVGDGRRCVKD